MHRVVSVYKRVLTGAGKRCVPVVELNNGRIKQDWVVVDDKEERHPEGSYYISWYEKGKLRRISVGKDAGVAYARQQAKITELSAVNQGIELKKQDGPGNLLSIAITNYLDEIKLTKKKKTLAAYTTALDYFAESCTKEYLSQVERKDMLQFAAFLRDVKEQSPRSVYNKFENVMSFLKSQGIRGLIGKNDWPRFTEEEPEIYEQSELDSLFKACTEEERLWFEFFLMTGMREQEVMYCYWTDVNLQRATVKVSHKPDRGWTPKAYKEREVPIPTALVNTLKARKAKADKKCNLVFPTSGCNPKLDFLDCLKACAERAELKKEDFWLHKFRATFATWHLWAGIDLRTVQHWLGHSDLESTMRYLKPNHNEQAQQKVNDTFSKMGATAGGQQ
jgi:integrase/recombinase XerD